MENYIVSARKYRPSTFESVVGQQTLTTTLKNAIASGKLAHAYLFCGPRGVGKTTCARIFAKTINCQHLTAEGEACNACESCQAFNEQRSYNIFELDAASNNSVEDTRNLIEEVRIPPQIGKYKIYIIDEVHMLSTAAFNAFLKTLEEPPRHAVFILATTEKQKLLPTILSRCQIYDFNRINVQDIVDHLQHVADREGVKADPEALAVIAQKADGGMRDALSIFDQVVSFTQGNISYKSVIDNLNVLDYEYYFRLTDLFLAHKVSDSLLLFNDILRKGFDGNHFITGLAAHLRDLLVCKDEATLPLLEVGDRVKERYREQARRCSSAFLFKGMKRCNDCDLNYRASKNKRLLIELTLIECTQLIASEEEEEPEGRSPEKRLKPLFKQSGKAHASTSPPPTQPQTAQTTIPPIHVSPLPSNKPDERKIPTVNIADINISIKAIKNNELQSRAPASENTGQKPDTTAPLQNEPFSVDDLDYGWREFAASLPVEQKANSQKMMALHPKLMDQTTFEIVVDNKMAAESMQTLTSSVEEFLRKKLRNDHIKMRIRVSEIKENKRPFTAPEKLQFMLKKNPHLQELKDSLGLELS